MLTTILKSLRRNRARTRALLFAISGIAVGTAALTIYAVAQSTPPTLESLLPKDTEVVGSVRSDWLWQTTASIRQVPAVTKALSQAEQTMGLSIDDDIVPWAGRVGVSAYGISDNGANVIVYAEIRDTGKFMATLAKLQAKWAKPGAPGAKPSNAPQFSTQDYHGVTVYSLTSKHAALDDMPVSFAILNGWAVGAVGKGAMEHALDVYQGRYPSIQANPYWSPVIAQLPHDAQVWGGVDVGRIATLFSGPDDPFKGPNAAAAKACYAGALVDEGTGLRSVVVSAPETPAAQAMYQEFSRSMKPVSDQILNRAPDAVCAMIISNPAFLSRVIQTSLLHSAQTPKERREIEKNLKAAAPYLEPLQYFHNDAGLVFTWRKDRGFGVAILARGDSHAAAVHAAKSVVNDLKQTGIPLMRGGNSWSAAIPGLDMMVPPTVPVKLAPFISAKDDWLIIGSNPSWTAPQSTPPALHLPAGSDRAMEVGILSMRFLPAVFTVLEQNLPRDNSDAQQGLALARGLNLEGSTWTMVGIYAPDGRSALMNSEVTGWDWHAALDNTVKAIENWKPSTPAKGHDLLKHRPDMSFIAPPSLRG